MAKERKLVLKPPAHLEPRASDVELGVDQFQKLSLFANMKKGLKLDDSPGVLVLRRFAKDEVICRQGESGWTAFYALTPADRATLGLPEVAEEEEAAPRHIVTVHIFLPRPPAPASTGLIGKLLGMVGVRARPGEGDPRHIPIDAPRDADYHTRQARILEGELFGEMSCKHGSPRSGTVVAEDNCYLLEMLRTVLEQVEDDPGYQKKMDEVYRDRVLDNQLRKLAIFDLLDDDQYAGLRGSFTPDQLDLVRYKVGDIICDEHDRPDCVYLVRNGLIQTVKNRSDLLAVADVTDWKELAVELRKGVEAGPALLGQVWQKLTDAARDALQRADGVADGAERQEVVYGLNEFIKAPVAATATAWPHPQGDALAAYISSFPKSPKDWSDPQRRRAGRLCLEELFPRALVPRATRDGRDFILSYQSTGDVIGEIGLVTGLPRSATCVAYVHPDPGEGHQKSAAKWRKQEPLVELVKIHKSLFDQLQAKPLVKQKVKQIVEDRLRRDAARKTTPPWDHGREPVVSRRFEQLGLGQGQRLMLIDLDRCTRCDECVQACVDSHADGRSRLFLDGPRYGKYLVPATCRSCQDPVCLIGCPVGSIHRGNNREIVIKDWCIGCGLCATNCPYGSIQMHDRGVIPEGSHGWEVAPAAAGPWRPGRTPVLNDADLRAGLRLPADAPWAGEVWFRYSFPAPKDTPKDVHLFRLAVTTPNTPTVVRLNGTDLTPDPAWGYKQGRREFDVPRDWLRRNNELVIQVTAAGKELEKLLDVRLDEIHEPDLPRGVRPAEGETLEVSEKLVKQVAVVCDLCSSQWGQRPACVTACPHDAAVRVSARTEFPGQ